MKYAVVNSPRSEFIELARVKSGRIFRKQILRDGEVSDPRPGYAGQKIQLGDSLYESLIKNFEAGVCDIVQIPMVGDTNAHSEAPDRNLGEVVGLEKGPGGLYALLDIRKADKADEMGKTLLGASAMFSPDYTDTFSGSKVGPTLLHVAITNRPHITGLEPFSELVAASADHTSVDDVVVLTPTKESNVPKTIAEWAAEIKAEHPTIDLEALIANSSTPPAATEEIVAALSAAFGEDKIKFSSTAPTVDEIVAGVKGIMTVAASENVALSARIGSLEEDARKARIAGLVKEGFIAPAQEEAMLKLSKLDAALFESMLPKEPIIVLSQEEGLNPAEPPPAATAAEIARYAAMAAGKKD